MGFNIAVNLCETLYSSERIMKSYNVKMESRAVFDCFKIAVAAQGLARRAEESWEINYHCVTGITFTAFAIEAMLNHFGKILFIDWNNLKTDRKESHKKLFKAVNLPNYLGRTTYQKARSCFQLRDQLAHGKTEEETLNIELPHDLQNEDVVRHITSIPIEPVREISLELLDEYISVAQQIEKDIQDNGFYPNQEHLPQSSREKLLECPLSSSGGYSW